MNYHADVNNVSQEGNHVFQMMCERAQECTPTCLTMLDEGANPDATNEVNDTVNHCIKRETPLALPVNVYNYVMQI